MKEKQYKIQNVTLKMGEMTLGQDKKLLDILNERKFSLDKIDSMQKIMSYMMKEDMISDFLAVVLKGDIDKIEMNEITNSELEEIISDFFELNGGWIKKLNVLLNDFLKKTIRTIPSPDSKTSSKPKSSTTN